MATKSLKKITELGEALYLIRQEINAIELEVEAKTKMLKDRRDQLQQELLESLQATNLSSIKTAGGDSFIRSKRLAFAFNTPITLERVAAELKCMRPDSVMLKSKLLEVVKRGEALPEGVKQEEVEYISVRKAKVAEKTDA